MKRLYTVGILTSILLLSGFLRLWQLGAVPVSPDWDEVSIGYNAYSILRTGRDEYGTFLPLTFRSFDDYKPPMYVYLTVPSVAVFGLNVFAVRLPSAIFGILAVLGTYFLVVELLKSQSIALLSTMLLAISPWHIQFSRIAFEANIGLTINIWAVYFFLRGIYYRRGLMISFVLFALALYTYHSERIFVPSLVLLLCILYRNQLLKNKKTLAVSFLLGFIVVLPLVPVLFSRNALMRLKGTSSFREQTQLLAVNIQKLEYDKAHNYFIGQIFDNRRIEFVKTILRGYLIHFSPKWLFVTGDHERHHAPGMGLLYFWELPFIFIGIFQLLRVKKSSSLILLGWFILAPIAASPTTQLPHAIRTLVFLPTFQIFTAIGMLQFASRVKHHVSERKIRYSKIILALIFTFHFSLFTLNFMYYLHMYFVHMNVEYSRYWQYGYKQAVEYAEARSTEYKKIVVSTDLEQPYIFFLFYSKYDPRKYLAQGGTLSGSFDEKYNRFKTYEFRKIDWPNEKRDGSVLYIGTPDEIVHGTKANITYLDGTPAINITDRE